MDVKTVIDKNGFIIDSCVNVIDGKTENFELNDTMQLVARYAKGKLYVKPRWNGQEWIEGATDEEIHASKEDIIESELSPTLESRVQCLEDALLQSLDLGV